MMIKKIILFTPVNPSRKCCSLKLWIKMSKMKSISIHKLKEENGIMVWFSQRIEAWCHFEMGNHRITSLVHTPAYHIKRADSFCSWRDFHWNNGINRWLDQFSSPPHITQSNYTNQKEHLQEPRGLESFGLLSFQLLLSFVWFSKCGLI